MKKPYERECMYCGTYFTPHTSKGTHCNLQCSQRHYKERIKRRKLTERGFAGIFPQTPIPNKPFYNLIEAADILAITRQAIGKWIKKHQINVLNIEGHIRIPYQEINRILKKQEDEHNN
jgi:hypothetical protein